MKVLPLVLAQCLSVLLVAPLTTYASRHATEQRWRYIRSVITVFFVSIICLALPFEFRILWLGHANWVGKVLSIFASYILITKWPAAAPARQYLTFKQRAHSWRISVVCIALLILEQSISIVLNSQQWVWPKIEYLLFEASMPGLDEEMVFRAGILACLIAACGNNSKHRRSPLVWPMLITSILFGLVHALNLDPHFHLHFDISTFLDTATFGLIIAALAVNSRSILLPVIVHNLLNVLAFFRS